MARSTANKQRNVVTPKTPTTPGTTPKYSHQFINVHLNKADTDWLTENDPQAYEHVGAFYDSFATGYEVTLREDFKSGRWNAMLKCSATDDPNSGYILSVRAATAFDALFALAYSHSIKFSGTWHDVSDTGSSRFN